MKIAKFPYPLKEKLELYQVKKFNRTQGKCAKCSSSLAFFEYRDITQKVHLICANCGSLAKTFSNQESLRLCRDYDVAYFLPIHNKKND